MNKITQLWVRACKSNNATTRCTSILRRFYMGGVFNEKVATTGIIIHLTDVVEKYCPMKTIDILNAFCENSIFYKDDRSNHEKARDMLITRIRQTERSKFEGLATPLWCKNKFGI